MILKNGLVFTEDARFVLADVEIADGKIAQVAAPGTLDGPDAVDVSGKYVTPGFVDIHIHGSKGSDFCDAGAEHIETMSAYLGGEGVTAFCGTTMAFDEPILTNIFNIAKPYINKETGGAVLRGFTAAMMLGVVVGTYSSIYVSSSLLITLGLDKSRFRQIDGAGDRKKAARARAERIAPKP